MQAGKIMYLYYATVTLTCELSLHNMSDSRRLVSTWVINKFCRRNLLRAENLHVKCLGVISYAILGCQQIFMQPKYILSYWVNKTSYEICRGNCVTCGLSPMAAVWVKVFPPMATKTAPYVTKCAAASMKTMKLIVCFMPPWWSWM